MDLARQLYGPGLARVVNGSLRSVQRLGDAVRTPDFYAGPADEETFFAEDAAAATAAAIMNPILLFLLQNTLGRKKSGSDKGRHQRVFLLMMLPL